MLTRLTLLLALASLASSQWRRADSFSDPFSQLFGGGGGSGSPFSQLMRVNHDAQPPPPSARNATEHIFIATMGCPLGDNDDCYTSHASRQRMVLAGVIKLKPRSTLKAVRKQLLDSELSHIPAAFCFMFKDAPLDPSLESEHFAVDVAVAHNSRSVHERVLALDTKRCAGKFGRLGMSSKQMARLSKTHAPVFAIVLLGVGLAVYSRRKFCGPTRKQQVRLPIFNSAGFELTALRAR